MIRKTNILKIMVVAIAMVMTMSCYGQSKSFSPAAQQRIRTLVSYLDMNSHIKQPSTDVMVRGLAKMDASAVTTLEKMGVQVEHIQGQIYSLYFNMPMLGQIRKVEGVRQVDLSRQMKPVDDSSSNRGEPRQVIKPI